MPNVSIMPVAVLFLPCIVKFIVWFLGSHNSKKPFARLVIEVSNNTLPDLSTAFTVKFSLANSP